MPDEFSEFLDDPTGTTFLSLRAVVLASPEYQFYSDGLDELTELVDGDDFAAVPDKVAELMPGWLLSPRVHALAGHAAERAGDDDRARLERYLAQACLRGLLQSGEGSQARPYRVTHVADEYDVLEALGKPFASQRQVVGDDGVFDLVACGDGSELWFDVTAGSTPAV